MTTLNILAPVVLVIALGALLCRRGQYSAAFFRDANRLTYWIGLPAMLFREVAAAPLRESWAGPLVGVLLAATFLTAAAGLALARAGRLPAPRTGALVSCAFRGNLAYAGLPILLFALPAAGGGAGAPPWAATAALCLGPMVLVYNVACVVLGAVLTHGRAAGARALVRDVAANPLILACAAGLAVSVAGVPLPAFLARTLGIVGNLALPMALLGLGASFDAARLRAASAAAVGAALLKTAFCPLAGWALARWVGLGPEETLIALVYLACPTAISMYVMAKPLGMDEHLTGAAIMLSTLFSAVPLALVLVFAGG